MKFWTPANLARITRGSWVSAATLSSTTPPTAGSSPSSASRVHRDHPAPSNASDSAQSSEPSNASDSSVGVGHAPIRGLSIDTRTLIRGQAYLALAGDRHDGHDFIPQAIDAGASLIIASKRESLGSITGEQPVAVLLVPDTQAALTELAGAYRDHLASQRVTVIAVAGSNGKTTTRRLIHAVLATRRVGSQSPRNYNNHIGVPLTLLSATDADDYLVVEVGTNQPGEVDALARLVRPDIAVVCSIGHEHLQGLGTLEQVAAEEASLIDHVRPGGVAIVPHPEAWPEGFNVKSPAGVALRRFGDQPGCDVELTGIWPSPDRPDRMMLRIGGAQILELGLAGRANAHNAAAAVAVARWLGIGEADLAGALLGVMPMEGRLQMLAVGEVTVIHDAYNANPESTRQAIDVLKAMPGRRRIAVLGDMLELGETAPDLHAQVGHWLIDDKPAGSRSHPGISASGAETPVARATGASTFGAGALPGAGAGAGLSNLVAGRVGVQRAIFAGPLSQYAGDVVTKAWGEDRVQRWPDWNANDPQLVARYADDLAQQLQPGDVVLLKASRGLALENLLPALIDRFLPPE